MKKKCLGIITARGGSKRIPQKNIRLFLGKPIIVYSIEAALDSNIFDELMVSTDNLEIAEIAKEHGAKVPFFRSEKTSSDYATTAEVILEVLSEYQKRGFDFEYVACIYATAPFVTLKKLQKGMNIIENSNAALAMPIVPFSYPPQRCYIVNNGKLQMRHKENLNKRSQDLEILYHDCGQFYFYNVKKFIDANGQISDNIEPIYMNEIEVQDIDNLTDWEIAEIKYKYINKIT